MITDFTTVERLAKQLCADAGRDWDSPYTKRVKYIRRARRVLEQDLELTLWERLTWWLR